MRMVTDFTVHPVSTPVSTLFSCPLNHPGRAGVSTSPVVLASQQTEHRLRGLPFSAVPCVHNAQKVSRKGGLNHELWPLCGARANARRAARPFLYHVTSTCNQHAKRPRSVDAKSRRARPSARPLSRAVRGRVTSASHIEVRLNLPGREVARILVPVRAAQLEVAIHEGVG